MTWVAEIMIFMFVVLLGIVFASIAISYLPDSVKDWLKEKLFKKGGKKKDE